MKNTRNVWTEEKCKELYSMLENVFARYHVDDDTRCIIRTALVKSSKQREDFYRVLRVLCRYYENRIITEYERIMLVTSLSIKYHDDGKIEGVYSLDSTAHGCTFCTFMRNKARVDGNIICGACYDYKQEKYRYFVTARHFLNMVILSSVEFTVFELKYLQIPHNCILRINSSGDIQNNIHAYNVVKLAHAFEDCTIGLWSKNVYCVENAFNRYGKRDNMTFIQSTCAINGKPAYISNYADNIFTVYDKQNINDALKNASECNGKKCAECGYKCYYKAHACFNVAELLR